MHNPLDLTGKTILVTGASSGIGRAIAILCGQLGARVVLGGRREGALRETQAALPNAEMHRVEPFDLTAMDGIPAWITGVRERAEAPLDGLVHSAGLSVTMPIRVANRANTDNLMIPNVYAALGLLRGFSAKGVAAGQSSVVLLSSVASFDGSPGLVTYAGTKGAINGIVRSAAKELGPRRVRVNAIAPGYVETPMYHEMKATTPDAVITKLEEEHFLGIPKPEEVAVMAAYLLSDAARVVTGTMLVIDGGYSA
ncbi:MAG: SDR family oxidoreductase [Gemmatimonadaceae bacterium]|nr:SDR family oxidoreductase [Gemmatimonadaceae bacterium]